MAYKPSPPSDPVSQRMSAEVAESVRLLAEADILGLPEPEARRRIEERGLLWRTQKVGQSVVDASMATRRVTATLDSGVVVEAEVI